MIVGRSRTLARVSSPRPRNTKRLHGHVTREQQPSVDGSTRTCSARNVVLRPENETPYHFVEGLIPMKSTWNRPDFEEVGSGFEVTAYMNDWDQDRI